MIGCLQQSTGRVMLKLLNHLIQKAKCVLRWLLEMSIVCIHYLGMNVTGNSQSNLMTARKCRLLPNAPGGHPKSRCPYGFEHLTCNWATVISILDPVKGADGKRDVAPAM